MRTTRTCERPRWLRARAALAFPLLLSVSAMAHHSFAIFDLSSTASQKGVVKEVQWANPHVWLHLTVDESGKPPVLAYEGAAIAVLKRVGWFRDTIKPGDVVTVVGHPRKDGRGGGSIEYLILADGSKLGTGDAIPGALIVPGVK